MKKNNHTRIADKSRTIPVLQPLGAANDPLPREPGKLARQKGWDAREVWRTRIKGERSR